MVTVPQIVAADPSRWQTAEEALARLARDMNEAADGLYDRGAGALKDFWPDQNGAAAQAEIRTLAAGYSVLAMHFRAACSILSGVGLALTTCRSTVLDGCEEARRYGYQVGDDGFVTVPRSMLTSLHAVEHILRAMSIQQRIREAVRDASSIDEQAAAALRNPSLTTLDVDQDGVVDQEDIHEVRSKDRTLDQSTQATLQAILGSMPLDDSPQAQRRWWEGLSEEERRKYLNAAPLEVAGMKGVPDEVRSELSGTEELGYDRLALLRYAQENWRNTSLDYMDNNCTNFVSQALEHAGLDHKGWWPLDRNGWNRGPVHRVGDDPIPGTHTHSWGGADAQHDLFARSGSPHVEQRDVRPGDIAYWSQEGPGGAAPGEEHHAAIVTGVLPNGDILYTQHTDNREDQSLAARGPYGNVSEGDQKILFVRVKQTW